MQNNRTIIYLAGFLSSIPIALTAYINSSFISSFIGEKFVGIIYVLGSIIAILALLITPKIFKRLGGHNFLLLATFLSALSFLILALVKNIWIVNIIFILSFSINTLIFLSLDEILKIFSENSLTGKTRGLYLTACSVAWVLAQLASGTILGSFSYKQIYSLGFFVMISFFIFLFLKLKNIADPIYDKTNNFKYIREFFKNKNLSRSYVISFLLQFFYCWMIIYTPIYLHNHIGFSWREIGIIFSVMLLPFVFIPFGLGKYADKIGEKNMLMIGFIIISISTLSLFFIHKNTMWIWILCLFITRIGAATVEIMGDVYFFKNIKSENEEFVGFYRTAPYLSYILGSTIASVIFIFIPSFNFIYVILSAIMLSGIYVSSRIK